MIRTTFGLVATLVVIAVLVGATPAQFTGQGVGGQFLLFNKSVQDELKLTPDQVTKLRADAEAALGTFKDQLGKIREMEPQARARLLASVTDKTNRIVAGVLDKDQVQRLRQIDLQQRGPLALYDEEVRKNLNITEAQLGKLKAVADATFQDLQKAHEAKDEKQMDAACRAAIEKVNEILTEEQRRTYQEMIGRPFAIRMN